MTIDSKVVQVIIFEDGSTLRFPIKDDNIIKMETIESNKTNIRGDGNTVIQGKNIVNGSVMNVNEFRLGDG